MVGRQGLGQHTFRARIEVLILQAELRGIFCCSGGLFLRGCIGVECVHGDATFGGVMLDDAVNLCLVAERHGGAIDGSHGGGSGAGAGSDGRRRLEKEVIG